MSGATIAKIEFMRGFEQFYENLVPSCTIYDVECPDHSFRKFTDDGQYLISFSRNHQDLIVYRPTWLSFSCKEENCDSHELPPKAKKFESFFTQLYCISLASSNQVICKDFFLYVETHQFGLFATSTAQIQDATATGGAIDGVPSIERITFLLVRLEDGVVLDEKVFYNDFVNLTHSTGVFLYDDLLSILSLRYQTIHILQIRDSGNLVNIRAIGTFCREDDELFLNSHAQANWKEGKPTASAMLYSCLLDCMSMAVLDRGRSDEAPTAENGQPHHQQIQGGLFLTGIKQRLLSFIFRGIWNEQTDHTQRVQSLKKKFYFHFQDYIDLIMWKVQFLDQHHLLIKLGSVDGAVSRTTDQHLAFFAVYNMETTEIISFYPNSAEELYYLFEQFCDHFHATSKNLYMNFISSHSNNIHALEQLRSIKNKGSNVSQRGSSRVIKLISATDRHRQSTENPIKFISRRQPNTLKFKIKLGMSKHFIKRFSEYEKLKFIQGLIGQPMWLTCYIKVKLSSSGMDVKQKSKMSKDYVIVMGMSNFSSPLRNS
ncbi:acid phosphatase det1 [Asimina triloba]